MTIRVSDRAVSRRFHEALLGPPSSAGDRFDEWSGADAGYESDGDPGPRPQYDPTSDGASLLDPDGDTVEAVHHHR